MTRSEKKYLVSLLNALQRLSKTEKVHIQSWIVDKYGYPISDDDYSVLKTIFNTVKTVTYATYDGDIKLGFKFMPCISNSLIGIDDQKYLVLYGDYWHEIIELIAFIKQSIAIAELDDSKE